VRDDTAERMRGLYNFRRNRFSSRFEDGADRSIEEQSQAYQRLRRELLDAERDAVTQLGRAGEVSGDVVNRVRRDLDLEDARLDV
jgi:monovalent cation/hydrogen antiporter